MTMTTAYRRGLAAVAIVVTALVANACAPVTVNHILADPSRYANRDVRLEGEVVKSASALGRGAYQLEDGTGTIWVVSRHGVPRKGAYVSVKGKVKDAFDLSSVVQLPGVIANGLVLVESSHKARR
jgi:hypothetical protein